MPHPVLHPSRPDRVIESKQSTPQALQRYLKPSPGPEGVVTGLVVRGILAKGSEVGAPDYRFPITPDPSVSVAEIE